MGVLWKAALELAGELFVDGVLKKLRSGGRVEVVVVLAADAVGIGRLPLVCIDGEIADPLASEEFGWDAASRL